MKTIWKTEIPLDGEWHLVAGRPLHFDKQRMDGGDTVPMVWFETPVEPYEPVEVRLFGTGSHIPDEATYIGTWVGPFLVWHAYSRPVEDA